MLAYRDFFYTCQGYRRYQVGGIFIYSRGLVDFPGAAIFFNPQQMLNDNGPQEVPFQ